MQFIAFRCLLVCEIVEATVADFARELVVEPLRMSDDVHKIGGTAIR